MVLVAEDEVEREHAALRHDGRGIGGGVDDEVDVAGADLLRHLGFLAELGAVELVDGVAAAAEFFQFGVELVGEEAVAGVVRFVMAKAEDAGALTSGDGRGGERCDGRGGARPAAACGASCWLAFCILPLT